MANTYATVEDLARVWDGRIKDGDEERVLQLLTYAHALLRAKAPVVDTRFDAGSLDPALLQMVLVNAVIRVLNNPRGVQGAGTGETNFYYAQSGSERFGTLYIDDDELSLLGLTSKGSARIAAFTMGSPYAVIHDEPWRRC
jgi:hypothetical protein